MTTVWHEPYGFKWFRQTMRYDLIRSLKAFCPPTTLRTLVLQIGSPSVDIAEDPPLPATEDGGTTDALGSAFHHAVACIGNLEHLVFHGEVDDSFFWPYSTDKPEPFWQSLKTLTITMDLTLPSGDLYFRDEFYDRCVRASKNPWVTSKWPEETGSLPPGYGDKPASKQSVERLSEMEGRQREIQVYAIPDGYNDQLDSDDEDAVAPKVHKLSMVNRPAMTTLLEAIIKSVAQMKSLEHLRLGGVRRDFWAMEFNAPGIRSDLDRFVDTQEHDNPLAYARVYMRRVIWTPDDTTLDKFREMAVQKYGREAIITFIDQKHLFP
ncbi:hypothetical protein CkaCkLH20_10724 [Colletotrichum karsti]|uniref:Uncharacterized protein n=1 Tax=Colletotrichum karsti TaxID=1095194 RepID=A0A9P6HX86_9PEZI|nr:uncharacterized protein CkaCkLH20_10724 [Colletotrichum karsti]KAF9871790.1 hypothetical protein CkaCkLH20_10724 [Colletotrichum karsti]